MTEMVKSPADCATMADLRPQIDRIDVELIDLLVQRAGYIDRAVDLKKIEKLPALTPDRVAEVLANVHALAAARDFDTELVATLWDILIRWSTDRERVELGDGIPE